MAMFVHLNVITAARIVRFSSDSLLLRTRLLLSSLLLILEKVPRNLFSASSTIRFLGLLSHEYPTCSSRQVQLLMIDKCTSN